MAKRLSAKEKQRIESLFSKLAATINPKSDLEFGSKFELLVAVILSAQATDKQVNKVTKVLFSKANTPESIYALGVKGLENEVKSIGLFRNKAKNIHKTCDLLIKNHNSKVPADRKELEKLPGVGKKTAGVVLNVGFNQPTIPVDTHVFRLSHRLGLATSKTADKTEEELTQIVPPAYRQSAHHLLILHGRYVCKARKPDCLNCLIFDECSSIEKTVDADKNPVTPVFSPKNTLSKTKVKKPKKDVKKTKASPKTKAPAKKAQKTKSVSTTKKTSKPKKRVVSKTAKKKSPAPKTSVSFRLTMSVAEFRALKKKRLNAKKATKS